LAFRPPRRCRRGGSARKPSSSSLIPSSLYARVNRERCDKTLEKYCCPGEKGMWNAHSPVTTVFFFFTLVTGPRRSLGLQLSDTRVYEPQIRDAPWGAGLISKQKRVMIIHPLCASYSTSEKHGVRNTDEGQQNLLLGITVQGFLAHKKTLTP